MAHGAAAFAAARCAWGAEGSNGRQDICAWSGGITRKAVISKEVMAFFVSNTTKFGQN